MPGGSAFSAFAVTPPRNIYVIGSTASSVAHKLPAEFVGNWITVQADGVDLWVRFGIATGTADETAVSVVTSNEPAAAANGIVQIAADEAMSFDLGQVIGADKVAGSRVWMIHKESATGGYVRFWKSSGRA